VKVDPSKHPLVLGYITTEKPAGGEKTTTETKDAEAATVAEAAANAPGETKDAGAASVPGAAPKASGETEDAGAASVLEAAVKAAAVAKALEETEDASQVFPEGTPDTVPEKETTLEIDALKRSEHATYMRFFRSVRSQDLSLLYAT
jgi:hypothetical protein